MFAEKLDALMNIAEVTNSQLGRCVNINPSHIGRLRSGARPLPKKHDYMTDVCRFLAKHIQKEYQINALQKLTGIEGSAVLAGPEKTALYLERWLLNDGKETAEAAGRFVSGFSNFSPKVSNIPADSRLSESVVKYSGYLYGNAGKRKAVEQFFAMILQEESPQTLLLFSDEDMAWLYEDAAFAAKWAELFIKVLLKGNQVKIIHTISRDMNEMLEAVTKWIPVYMTGRVKPYYYPRLRDGIFHRTLFIAPHTAAIVSSSVQQKTDGMLNLFLTDKAALKALTAEYENYFSLCRPLMQIFTRQDADTIQGIAKNLAFTEGDAYLLSALPPLFTMPQQLARSIAVQNDDEAFFDGWKNSFATFKTYIKKQHLTLVLPEPQQVLSAKGSLHLFTGKLFSDSDLSCTKEQYELYMKHLKVMEQQFENLNISFAGEVPDHILLYIKENSGVIMAQLNQPQTVFYINERTMVSAFWDYMVHWLNQS